MAETAVSHKRDERDKQDIKKKRRKDGRGQEEGRAREERGDEEQRRREEMKGKGGDGEKQLTSLGTIELNVLPFKVQNLMCLTPQVSSCVRSLGCILTSNTCKKKAQHVSQVGQAATH